MKLIPLSKEKFSKVDDEDYEKLSKYNWFFNNGYACRHITKGRKNRKIKYIHQEIMGFKEVDHKNLDRLDNQKSNLRACSRSQNIANKPIQKNNTSGYKGVSYNKNRNSWVASIRCQGKSYFLGYYSNVIEAAKTRDKKAIELFGDFAWLNFS